jgi:hypothetical protein
MSHHIGKDLMVRKERPVCKPSKLILTPALPAFGNGNPIEAGARKFQAFDTEYMPDRTQKTFTTKNLRKNLS